MPYGTKIATCCYCGTRAALVLRGKDRHELSCSACGAPLHNMKMLRADALQQPVATDRSGGKPMSKNKPIGGTPLPAWSRHVESPGKKKKKKRKTLAKRFFEEAFDVLEDIFD